MLLDLFLCFFQVGLFSIGGGYAAMPMIQSKAVEYYHWLNMSEFTDLMTIAEMTPGPITVNSATFVGIRMAESRVRSLRRSAAFSRRSSSFR